MSAKTLLTLSASMLLGAAVVAPNAAFAQFLPPPPVAGPPPFLAGPPPGLGAGGPPPGLGAGGPPLGLGAGGPLRSGPPAGPAVGLRGPAGAPPRDIAGGRLDGAAGRHGLGRGGGVNFPGVEARAAAYSANGYTHNRYSGYGYGHDSRYWPYAAEAAAYAYGRSYASSDDGCYYRQYRYRRVLVCD